MSLNAVTRRFPPGTDALSNVSLAVNSGERVALVGPSGSGKTTLLSIMGLLDTPTSGDVELFGRSATMMTDKDRTLLRARHVGFVFQAFHLVPYLDALENVVRAMELAGYRGKSAKVRAVEALEAVGLGHRLTSRPPTMSGGEQQRVAIARALAREPQLLLCDEPTGNLDSVSADAVLELLMKAVSSTTALVIVTHDSAVAALCGRRITVHDGHVHEAAQMVNP